MRPGRAGFRVSGGRKRGANPDGLPWNRTPKDQQFGLVLKAPLGARVGNAVISYCRYLGKLFWPTNLAVFYPYPEHHWPMAVVFMAGIAMAGISALAFFQRRRHPYLLTGWL